MHTTDFIIVKKKNHNLKILLWLLLPEKKNWKNIFLKHFVNMFYIPQKESHPGAARGKMKQQNISFSSL